MGFFGGKKQPAAARGVPPLGSGARIRSERPIEACLALLEKILWSYREPQYPEMPAYFVPGWTWSSSQEAPDRVVCFPDGQEEFLLVALWAGGGHTEMGVYPLGSGDERLRAIPLLADWAREDPSLSRIGILPKSEITLKAPSVPENYCAELVGRRGFPATEANLAIAWAIVCQQFAIKAMQFISDKDRPAADRFIDQHRSDRPGREDAQRILDDLAAWNFGVLPYMQDIPMRIRALLLSMDEAVLWKELRS